MKTERTSRADEVVLALEGTFDVHAARRLEAALQRARPGAAVWLDFSRVRDFHDHAMAALADALEGAGAHVRVRGLRRHQARLLRYLGAGAADESAGVGATDDDFAGS